MVLKKLVFAIMFSLAIPLLLGFAQEAEAASTVILRSPTGAFADETCTDNDPCDLDPTEGSIVFLTNNGQFSVELILALTKPILGTDKEPQIDINVSALSAGSPGVLEVIFTDDDFPNIFQNYFGLATIGGTTEGSVNYETYWDPDNVQFAQQTLISQFLNLGFGPGIQGFNDQQSVVIEGINSPFSLTQVITINHDSAGQLTTLDANLQLSPVVGGFDIPIDNVALILAGVQTSFVWILPAVAIVGAGLTYIKLKKN